MKRILILPLSNPQNRLSDEAVLRIQTAFARNLLIRDKHNAGIDPKFRAESSGLKLNARIDWPDGTARWIQVDEECARNGLQEIQQEYLASGLSDRELWEAMEGAVEAFGASFELTTDQKNMLSSELRVAELEYRAVHPTPAGVHPAPPEAEPAGSQSCRRSCPDTETRRRIHDFLTRVNRETGGRYNKRHIRRVAGYHSRTVFQEFQREDEKVSDSARHAFNRVLEMTPEDFAAKADRLT